MDVVDGNKIKIKQNTCLFSWKLSTMFQCCHGQNLFSGICVDAK